MEASDEPGGKVFLADGCGGGCSVRLTVLSLDRITPRDENGAMLAIHQRSR
jgi:hypothetical protein